MINLSSYQPELKPNKNIEKGLSDASHFLTDEMGLFIQQDKINDFKSMCRDMLERSLSNKICICVSNNEYA